MHTAYRTGLLLLPVLGGLFLAPLASAETLVVTPPKSVFVDKLGFGKDPFFPESKRRENKAVVKTNSVVRLDLPAKLVLKGLSGTRRKPLAIINNATFESGEKGKVKIEGRKIEVICLEIKERSVRVRVNGRERELFLREKL